MAWYYWAAGYLIAGTVVAGFVSNRYSYYPWYKHILTVLFWPVYVAARIGIGLDNLVRRK